MLGIVRIEGIEGGLPTYDSSLLTLHAEPRQGVSSGVSGVITGVAKTGLTAVGGAGEKLASAGKAGVQTVLGTGVGSGVS